MFKPRKPVSIIALAGLLTLAAFSSSALAAVSYAGSWHAYFDGSNQGTCQIRITPSNQLTGRCKGNLPPFRVAGKVTGDHVRFGIASTGAEFSGVMVSGVHGIGHWQNGASSGDWYLRKN
ncbi:MAG: hypothetical protein ACYCQL_03695 [Acidithiobacillus sp.]